ncbi:MAG TPA: DsbE family thiol:disulfide interchange protein [Rhizobiales bacterium]|nr:DsbE family thiol:disulfide interchange protein [Hyphomicrobiales bacterium]
MTDTQQEAPERSRRSVWLALLPLIIFAGLVALFYRGFSFNRNLPSVLIGKPAPELDLPPLANFAPNGKQLPGIARGDLKKGEVTLVNFFASWCVPCRQEHPQLMKLGKMKGFRLVGMNYKNKRDEAVAFLNQLGTPFAAIGYDFNGRAGIEWGVVGVPETFLVDGKGIIRYKFIGPISPGDITEVLLPKIEAVKAGK